MPSEWTRPAALWSLLLRGSRLSRHAALGLVVSCGGSDATSVVDWSVVVESPSAALLSVSGTSADDVWMVGADGGDGPLVLHWGGTSWERVPSEVQGDLWWVQALPGGSVYMGGSSAKVMLRHGNGVMERLPTPGLAKHIVFGVWAASDDEVYAVGSAQGRNGFIWYSAAGRWSELPLPPGLPLDESSDVPGFFKVWGSSPEDVWVVGDRGVVLRGSAADGFALVPSGVDERVFTVAGASGRVVMVGGSGNGLALEHGERGLSSITPPGSGLLQGVSVTGDGAVWTVGVGGNVHVREGQSSTWRDLPPNVPVQSLHAVWADPEGGVWTVGGNVLSSLDRGVVLHRRLESGVSALAVPPAPEPAPDCPDLGARTGVSVARLWNEQLLHAIRHDVSRQPVHARDLFHLSVALWDAWATYDAVADGVVESERTLATDVDVARREALSFAAYRVLSPRYSRAPASAVCFEALMRWLGHDPSDTSAEGGSPSAVGNRIGSAVLEAFAADGANEAGDYADPSGYTPSNARLVVDLPGTRARDPLSWQELDVAEPRAPNGLRLGAGAGAYFGAHWGEVLPFSLTRASAGAPYVELGAPPAALGDAVLAEVVEVIARSAELDASDGVEEESTGEVYPRARALRADVARVMAEHWAHGPRWETPPGFWNALAERVAAHPELSRRLFGDAGRVLDALAWDVHLSLALNGALHDAAVAVWELKRRDESARPITLIRHLGGLGQRTRPGELGYHPEGLPLVDGLVEVITEESSAPGRRHAHLRRYVGEVALRSWRGEPGDRARAAGGVGWQRAKDWVPYERRSVVAPPFPGGVSEQSAFAHAAAVVLHRLTGSELLPGGSGRHRVEPGELNVELGPSEPVELLWGTYYDAAAQAGEAAVVAGQALRHDTADGQRVGVAVGERALARAASYYDGSARP